MKTSTKVSIGISIAAVAGITTAALVSEKLLTKVRLTSNRYKVKRFVSDKFDGNDSLLKVVDNLSDKDIDNVLKVAGKVKAGKKQVSVYGKNVKETTESAVEKFQDLIKNLL